MSNTFRTVQWNIGGGNVRANSASTEYDIDGLDAIIEKLEAVDPDLITLQETHTADGYSQAEIVSKALQLPYWVNDEYGESHINPAYRIGQAIISRFPLADTDFRLFLDSGYKAEWATRTHDKGVTSATVLVNDKVTVLAQTLHAVPFRAFGVDQASEVARPVLDDMQAKVLANKGHPRLLQGDFNLDAVSLDSLMPDLFEEGFNEVCHEIPTTPSGRIYDHILFIGAKSLDSIVAEEVLTDHYPIVSTFFLNS